MQKSQSRFLGSVEIDRKMREIARQTRLQRLKEVRSRDKEVSRQQCGEYRRIVSQKLEETNERSEKRRRNEQREEEKMLQTQWQNSLAQLGLAHRFAREEKGGLSGIETQNRMLEREKKMHELHARAIALRRRELLDFEEKTRQQSELRSRRKSYCLSEREDARAASEARLIQQNFLCELRRGKLDVPERTVRTRVSQSAVSIEQRKPVVVRAEVLRHGSRGSRSDHTMIRNSAVEEEANLCRWKWKRVMVDLLNRKHRLLRGRSAYQSLTLAAESHKSLVTTDKVGVSDRRTHHIGMLSARTCASQELPQPLQKTLPLTQRDRSFVQTVNMTQQHALNHFRGNAEEMSREAVGVSIDSDQLTLAATHTTCNSSGQPLRPKYYLNIPLNLPPPSIAGKQISGDESFPFAEALGAEKESEPAADLLDAFTQTSEIRNIPQDFMETVDSGQDSNECSDVEVKVDEELLTDGRPVEKVDTQISLKIDSRQIEAEDESYERSEERDQPQYSAMDYEMGAVDSVVLVPADEINSSTESSAKSLSGDQILEQRSLSSSDLDESVPEKQPQGRFKITDNSARESTFFEISNAKIDIIKSDEESKRSLAPDYTARSPVVFETDLGRSDSEDESAELDDSLDFLQIERDYDRLIVEDRRIQALRDRLNRQEVELLDVTSNASNLPIDTFETSARNLNRISITLQRAEPLNVSDPDSSSDGIAEHSRCTSQALIGNELDVSGSANESVVDSDNDLLQFERNLRFQTSGGIHSQVIGGFFPRTVGHQLPRRVALSSCSSSNSNSSGHDQPLHLASITANRAHKVAVTSAPTRKDDDTRSSTSDSTAQLFEQWEVLYQHSVDLVKRTRNSAQTREGVTIALRTDQSGHNNVFADTYSDTEIEISHNYDTPLEFDYSAQHQEITFDLNSSNSSDATPKADRHFALQSTMDNSLNAPASSAPSRSAVTDSLSYFMDSLAINDVSELSSAKSPSLDLRISYDEERANKILSDLDVLSKAWTERALSRSNRSVAAAKINVHESDLSTSIRTLTRSETLEKTNEIVESSLTFHFPSSSDQNNQTFSSSVSSLSSHAASVVPRVDTLQNTALRHPSPFRTEIFLNELGDEEESSDESLNDLLLSIERKAMLSLGSAPSFHELKQEINDIRSRMVGDVAESTHHAFDQTAEDAKELSQSMYLLSEDRKTPDTATSVVERTPSLSTPSAFGTSSIYVDIHRLSGSTTPADRHRYLHSELSNYPLMSPSATPGLSSRNGSSQQLMSPSFQMPIDSISEYVYQETSAESEEIGPQRDEKSSSSNSLTEQSINSMVEYPVP